MTYYPKSTVRIFPSKLESKHLIDPVQDALNEFPWRAHVKLVPSNDQRFLVPWCGQALSNTLISLSLIRTNKIFSEEKFQPTTSFL